MKALLLNFFLLFFLFQSAAQIPDYFANNPTWSCGYWELGQTPSEELNEDFLYYLSGDTLIQGNTYSTVNRKGFKNYYVGGPVNIWFDEHTKMYVRQVGRSIRFSYNHTIDTYDIWDSLLVNYELQIGDNVEGHIFYGVQGDTIQKIDSILINSEYRKVFFTDTITGRSFTEGIGHQTQDNGPQGEIFQPFNFGLSGNDSYIYCYGQNNMELWNSIGVPGNCNLSLNLEEQINTPTKTLIRVTDLMGRETGSKPNIVLIYIYNDGTTEKVFIVE